LETAQVGLLSELPFAGDDILISYMSNVKQEVARLLNKLPDDCSIEDVQYHLYVVEKVRLGLEDADANGALSQEEVEARLSKWLPK
jgi:hypothetical protein